MTATSEYRGCQLLEKVFSLMCFYYIFLTFIYRGKLPIALFVGQHFSGSLFHLITLLLFTRETTKGTRARELGAPSPYPLGFLPRGSLFPYSHPHSAWGVGGTRKTTGTLYILSMQGRLTLHVRILVHIS